MLESVTYIKRDDVVHTKLNDNFTSLHKATQSALQRRKITFKDVNIP